MRHVIVLSAIFAAGLIGPATPGSVGLFSSVGPVCGEPGSIVLGEVRFQDRRTGAEVWNLGATPLGVLLGDDADVSGGLRAGENWTWSAELIGGRLRVCGLPGTRYVVIPRPVDAPPQPEPDPAGPLLLGMLAGALVIVTIGLLAAHGRRRTSAAIERERDEARAEVADLRERLADIAERARLSEPETV